MNALKKIVLILGLMVFSPAPGLSGQTPDPVVHAILFYSPTCPHCHQVITEYLIPLQNQYGRRLVLIGFDTSQGYANNLYYEAVRHYEIPESLWAVPMMIVGDEVLVGGFDIPDKFPAILERGLASDGIDLPNYPALVTFLREQNALDPRFPDRLIALQDPAPGEEEPVSTEDSATAEQPEVVESEPPTEDTLTAEGAEEVGDTMSVTEEPAREIPVEAEISPTSESPRIEGEGAAAEAGDVTPVPEPADTAGGADSGSAAVGTLGLAEAVREMDSMTIWDRFNLDRMGNSLSVMVLLVMILTLVYQGYPPRVHRGEWPDWIIPALVAVGVGVAAYLSFIEVTHAEAVCGPVGDCNTVNQSKYAYLFGVLPVGILGLMGYGVIFVLWIVHRFGRKDRSRMAAFGLWGSALFGTVFSVYLTFLEPFVIGATCAWCLTSAVIMTLLLWATSPLAARVWNG